MTFPLEVFLTGGTGVLGTELIRQSKDINFVAPSSAECDITDNKSVIDNIKNFQGHIVLHAAASTNVTSIENDFIDACEINVCGTFNIIKTCHQYNKKLIFISTDYVFDGENGLYKTTDPINPLSKYAKSKASAELMVRMYDNSLIIRTSFFPNVFPYNQAFIDQWSSKDYVDVIAPKILKMVITNQKGIVHIGSKRRSIYEIAKSRNKKIKKCSKQDVNFIIPKDTSLEIK